MRKKALLVNDSKFESLILRDLLQQLNYDVEMADEFDALYQTQQFSPDLIIVNYIMQKTTGDKLIKDIKNSYSNIKCLLSSSSNITKKEIPQNSIDGVLRTPVSLFLLKDVLKRAGALDEGNKKDYNIIQNKNEDEKTGENKMYCLDCNKDLSSFSTNIVFCPYCGAEINYDSEIY